MMFTVPYEQLGAKLEYELGVPTRQRALIVRRVNDGVPRTFTDEVVLHPRVTTIPTKYLNLRFTDDPSGLGVNATDLLCVVPRIWEVPPGTVRYYLSPTPLVEATWREYMLLGAMTNRHALLDLVLREVVR